MITFYLKLEINMLTKLLILGSTISRKYFLFIHFLYLSTKKQCVCWFKYRITLFAELWIAWLYPLQGSMTYLSLSLKKKKKKKKKVSHIWNKTASGGETIVLRSAEYSFIGITPAPLWSREVVTVRILIYTTQGL